MLIISRIVSTIGLDISESGRLIPFPDDWNLPSGVFSSFYVCSIPKFKSTSKVFQINFLSKSENIQNNKRKFYEIQLLTEIPKFTDAVIWNSSQAHYKSKNSIHHFPSFVAVSYTHLRAHETR